MRSPYAVLGIDKSAESAAIKSAYRKLAKSWHPDQNHGDPEAGAKFAELTRAYQLLINPAMRDRFDRGDIDPEGRRRTATARNDDNEIFNIFRDAWRRRPKPRKPAAPDSPIGADSDGLADFDAMVKHIFGEDADTSVCGTADTGPDEHDPLSALDELFAKWKTIHRPRPGPARPAERSATAAERQPVHEASVEIDLESVVSGTRARIRTSGGVETEIAIPAGTPDGAVLRIEENARSGQPAINVAVRYRHHPAFRVEGRHLHLDTAITLDEAVLGGKVVVAGIDGPVRLSVPEWSSGHQPLILEGRGLMDAQGKRGDLHVHLSIRLPAKPDEAVVDLVRNRRKSLYV